MTLDGEQVWRKFLLLSGEDAEEMEPGREELCRLLCAECAEQAAREVREEEAARECSGVLETWAAAEAWAQLELADEVLEPESVSLPEIKWGSGDRAGKARRLAEEKRAACAPFLREAAFFFERV